MTTPLHCDAIKIAYRQSKDGFVVTFAIHPQDMPAELANADIGSQWRISLVPLDEHGNASLSPAPEVAAAAAQIPSQKDHQRQAGNTVGASDRSAEACPSEPRTVPRTTANAVTAGKDRQPRPFTSLPLPQQAALLCQDPVFWSFVTEEFDVTITNALNATDFLRNHCGVTSRRELTEFASASGLFTSLREQFMAWKLVAA